MHNDLMTLLKRNGAVQGQLVDLGASGARTLRYADLLRGPEEQRPSVVIESQGQPRAYVFEEQAQSGVQANLSQWVRRIALRGDADLVAVARPGRLDVFMAALNGQSEPQRVGDIPEGPLRLPTLLHVPHGGTGNALRKALRDLLRDSIRNAKTLGAAAGVDAHDALSLVGRALFWRFLIDRDLLNGLDPEEICGDPGVTTYPGCMDTKGRSLRTFEWLDQTFNGGLLAFRSKGRPAQIPREVYDQVVWNIAHGATADGQLRLPTDWSEINFAHVPVGLLSEVYEAYAHEEAPERAEAESIYYTPRHLAEFVVNETLASIEDVPRPKVLDPAAGAGVFLVAAFRSLVAREYETSDQRPKRSVIRRILNDQLFGFDINDSALRLTELALYLTAIELDPDPNPRPLSLLRFEKPLRDRALFLREGGPARGSLVKVDDAFRGKFDMVVGNPPWTNQVSMTERDAWEDWTRNLITERLGKERAEAFRFPDVHPDLPFVYRAMEWARPKRPISLFTHARWLFPGEGRNKARRDLLESVHVTGIVNGAGIRETSVWPESRAPFAILFARNEKPPADGAVFQFVSPVVDIDQQQKQERLRFDWSNADLIESRQAVKLPWLLKLRFRGTPFDEGIVRRLVSGRSTLEEYLHGLGADLKNGYRVGNRMHPADWLTDLPCLGSVRTVDDRFYVEPAVLPPCGEAKVEARRSRDIYRAPLLLIRQSPPADRLAPRSAVSGTDVAYSQSWHGASLAGVKNGMEHARYLQLVLQSRAFLYFLLLTDGGFGVERDRFVLENLKSFPIVPLTELSKEQRQNASKLSDELWSGEWTDALGEQIDEFVFDVYEMDDVEGQSVVDTFDTALPYAMQRKNAVRAPRRAEMNRFTAVLQQEMTNILDASGRRARVTIRTDATKGPWRVLQVELIDRPGAASADVSIPWEQVLTAAEDSGATLVTVEVEPNLRMVAILWQYRYWTVTRARQLALSLLSGKVT